MHLNERSNFFWWRSRWSAPALLGGLGVFALSLAILILGWSLLDPSSVVAATAVMVVANGILFAHPLLTRRRALGRPPVPPWRAGWVVDVAVGLVAVVPLLLLFTMEAPLIGGLLPGWELKEYTLYALEAPLHEPNLWWPLATWLICYPIADEVFHRAFLIGAFRKRIPRVPTLLLSSFIFGLSGGILTLLPWSVHFIRQGWVFPGLLLVLSGSAPYMLAGFALGLMYLWRKTLTAPLIAHLGSALLVAPIGLSILLAREAEPLVAAPPAPPTEAVEVGEGPPMIGIGFAWWTTEARVGQTLTGTPAE